MTKRIKTIKAFEKRLFDILPLYSVSLEKGFDNKVIEYSFKALQELGREPEMDDNSNILAMGKDEHYQQRVIVAHTDAVGVHDAHKRQQAIRYNELTDIIYNASLFRPMGGDDKVGVAVALAIAEFYPEFSVLLPSDEEVGCIGSGAYKGPEFVFGVQCDRRGSNDLINSIGGTIAGAKTTTAAKRLLQHRRDMSGMTTDVGTLVRRGKIKCAFNMSCGYYRPHSEDEYIILSEAIMACNDALTLLTGMIDTDFEDMSKNHSYPHYERYSGMSNSIVGGGPDGWGEYDYCGTEDDGPPNYSTKKTDKPLTGYDDQGRYVELLFKDGTPYIRIISPTDPVVTPPEPSEVTQLTSPAFKQVDESETSRGITLVPTKGFQRAVYHKASPLPCASCVQDIMKGEPCVIVDNKYWVCKDCVDNVDADTLRGIVFNNTNGVREEEPEYTGLIELPSFDAEITKLVPEAEKQLALPMGEAVQVASNVEEIIKAGVH